MNSTEIGQRAEKLVAKYLRSNGYTIIEQNWKVPAAEIDIVAKDRDCIVFVEVKYRTNVRQGNGFEYINERKLVQMAKAAELWVQSHAWTGRYELMAAAVTGSRFEEIKVIAID